MGITIYTVSQFAVAKPHSTPSKAFLPIHARCNETCLALQKTADRNVLPVLRNSIGSETAF